MSTTTVSRTRDGSRSHYLLHPLQHDEAADRARAYANRTFRATLRHGEAREPRLWITLYLTRYRFLTGRPRTAGPARMWDTPLRNGWKP